MLQLKRRPETGVIRVDTEPDRKQRRRMVLAVVLLLLALFVIAAKDHASWFGSNEGEFVADSDQPETAVSTPAPASAAASLPQKGKAHRAPIAAEAQMAEPPAIVASNRRVLPPLDIQVVAGTSRRTVQGRNGAVRVDMTPDMDAPASPDASATAALATNAAQRVTMSQDTAQAVDRSVDPSYPVLARQMKVQGAVVLQALIGNDGLIQDLRVLSGPAILASAAREAVRQWRFKPFLENGKPVETQARITVNFTISTF